MNDRKSVQERYNRLYDELVTKTLPFAGSLLARAAKLWPERQALLCEDQQLSYHEVFEQACSVSLFLESKNIKPGDRVVLLLENSLFFIIAYYGIWQTGAVITPLNTFLHENELLHIIQEAQPAAIITSSPFVEKLSRTSAQLPHLFIEQDIRNFQEKKKI